MAGDNGLERSILEGARRLPVVGACPPDERLVAFYDGLLDDPEADEVRDHLATCPRCLESAREARRFLVAMNPERVASSTRRRLRFVYAAAAILAGVALLVAGANRTSRRSDRDAANWVVSAAPYVLSDELVWRGGTSASGSLDAAAARYRAGDYAAAVDDLAAYVATHPSDARGHFYLGVARLLSGQAPRAVSDLEAAEAIAGAPTDTAWYLALARLRSGDLQRARDDLTRIAGSGGDHAEDAREILRRVDLRRGE